MNQATRLSRSVRSVVDAAAVSSEKSLDRHKRVSAISHGDQRLSRRQLLRAQAQSSSSRETFTFTVGAGFSPWHSPKIWPEIFSL
jgi:hypothetical protein